MPFILRKIRKSKWYKSEGTPWLAQGDLQADSLGDLTTQQNELSVWQIQDDLSNLDRVLAAMAASTHQISNLDYALLRQELLPGIKTKSTLGMSLDEDANIWHIDLIELSAQKLFALANVIQSQAQIKRKPEKEVLKLVAQAITSGQIDRYRLKPESLAKVEQYISGQNPPSE